MSSHATLISEVQRDLLGGDAVFPTSIQLATRIRQALDQDDISVDDVARLIEVEPLLTAKVVRMANCVTFNPSGREVFDVRQAIGRVGFNAVRSVSMAIALAQLKAAPALQVFRNLTEPAWQSSVRLAALSRLLARTQRGVNPDEAMLSGLVSEIGVFYLLDKAARHPEYVSNASHVGALLAEYATSVGNQFLVVMGMPGNTVQALSNAELPDIHPAKGLRAVIGESRRLLALPQPIPEDEPQAEWLQEVQDQLHDLVQALQA